MLLTYYYLATPSYVNVRRCGQLARAKLCDLYASVDSRSHNSNDEDSEISNEKKHAVIFYADSYIIVSIFVKSGGHLHFETTPAQIKWRVWLRKVGVVKPKFSGAQARL